MALAAPFPTAAARQPRRSPRTTATTRTTRATRTTHQPEPLRLTRRGRVVVGVGSGLLLLLVILVSGVFRADADSSLAAPVTATSVVVMQPGENLWQLAQQIAPTTDPREMVMRIRELNGLGDEAVRPGQAIVVPVGVAG